MYIITSSSHRTMQAGNSVVTRAGIVVTTFRFIPIIIRYFLQGLVICRCLDNRPTILLSTFLRNDKAICRWTDVDPIRPLNKSVMMVRPRCASAPSCRA